MKQILLHPPFSLILVLEKTEFGSASYVAREVIGAEDIVDYTVQPQFFDRFAKRLGASMAKILAGEFVGKSGFLLK